MRREGKHVRDMDCERSAHSNWRERKIASACAKHRVCTHTWAVSFSKGDYKLPLHHFLMCMCVREYEVRSKGSPLVTRLCIFSGSFSRKPLPLPKSLLLRGRDREPHADSSYACKDRHKVLVSLARHWGNHPPLLWPGLLFFPFLYLYFTHFAAKWERNDYGEDNW